jgi:hypothetical protein
VDADGGVGRAGAARHEARGRAAGQLAERFGGIRGAALLSADDQSDLVPRVTQRVEGA